MAVFVSEFVIVILLAGSRFRSCSYPQDSLTRLQITALNQDRTAIDHNRLARAESFLHQKQIGLSYVIKVADATHGQCLPNAFVQVLPFVCTHALPKVGPNHSRRYRVDTNGR